MNQSDLRRSSGVIDFISHSRLLASRIALSFNVLLLLNVAAGALAFFVTRYVLGWHFVLVVFLVLVPAILMLAIVVFQRIFRSVMTLPNELAIVATDVINDIELKRMDALANDENPNLKLLSFMAVMKHYRMLGRLIMAVRGLGRGRSAILQLRFAVFFLNPLFWFALFVAVILASLVPLLMIIFALGQLA